MSLDERVVQELDLHLDRSNYTLHCIGRKAALPTFDLDQQTPVWLLPLRDPHSDAAPAPRNLKGYAGAGAGAGRGNVSLLSTATRAEAEPHGRKLE